MDWLIRLIQGQGACCNVHPDGTDDVSYEYDAHGNQTVAESADFRYNILYDHVKFRREREDIIIGNTTNSIERHYDASGRDAGYTANIGTGTAYAAVQNVSKTRDPLGRLESISATVTGGSPIAVTNHYDGSRHIGYSVHAGNCVVIREIVYGQNRDVIESVINSVVTNGVTNVVSRYDYAYDAARRRTRRGDTALPTASTNLFTYNPRSELTTASMSGGEYLYGYDSQGNRLFSTNNAAGATYTPNGLNQYTSVDGTTPVYDADGNLLSIPGRMAMGYDAKNQLTQREDRGLAHDGLRVHQHAVHVEQYRLRLDLIIHCFIVFHRRGSDVMESTMHSVWSQAVLRVGRNRSSRSMSSDCPAPPNAVGSRDDSGDPGWRVARGVLGKVGRAGWTKSTDI